MSGLLDMCQRSSEASKQVLPAPPLVSKRLLPNLMPCEMRQSETTFLLRRSTWQGACPSCSYREGKGTFD
eukprot:3884006-Amphidinium_carterae.2